MRLIDADALIHELNNNHYPGAPYIDAGISIAIGKVCDALTIEPERKTGKWIWQTWSRYMCSECGRITNVDECMEEPMYTYCPYCGAPMVAEKKM